MTAVAAPDGRDRYNFHSGPRIPEKTHDGPLPGGARPPAAVPPHGTGGEQGHPMPACRRTAGEEGSGAQLATARRAGPAPRVGERVKSSQPGGRLWSLLRGRRRSPRCVRQPVVLLDEVNLLAGGTAAGCRPDNLHVSPSPFFASTWEVSASADGQAIRW